MHKIEGLNNVAGQFDAGPPATVVTPEWLNAIQNEIINTITYFGGQIYAAEADTEVGLRDVIIRAIQGYDYVTYSQSTFVELFERTGANAYQVKDDYKSILIRNMGVGYNLGNILSDGDTWGTVNLNNCTLLKFENGAKIDLSFYEMSIVCTDDNTIEGMWLDGGSNALARSNTLKLIDLDTAKRVSFKELKITNFNITDNDFQFIDGSSAEESMKFSGVSFDAISSAGTGMQLMYTCYNIDNCTVVNYDSADGLDKIFNTCTNLSNVYINDVDCVSVANAIHCFYGCDNLTNCKAITIDSTSGNIYGFYECYQISSCKASEITSTSGWIYGFSNCDQISSCLVNDMDSDTGVATGFSNCAQISSCKAIDIDSDSQSATGFGTCDQISSCLADDIDSNSGSGNGFSNCDQISSCTASNITSVSDVAYGFTYCNYGAALFTSEAVNSNNDFIDTTDAQITNKVSTPAVWT